MRGKIGQCFVYRDRQLNKFLEVLVVSRPLFCLLPQIFNRIVVWRIRRQRVHREAIGMLGKKLLRCLAGVIPCPIMDKKQVCGGLRHDRLPERLVSFRVEPALNALIEQTPGERVTGPKHLVAFALATGGDLGLVAPSGPGVAQRAPLRKAGLIFKQEQAFPTLSGAQDRGPYVPEPGLTPGCIEMVRHKARLLKRKPYVVQQRTDIMAIVEDTKLAPDQYPDEGGVPTGRLKAHDLWAGLKEFDQPFPLPWGQLRAPATTMVVDQAVHSVQQEVLAPRIEARRAEPPALAQHLHWHVVHEQVEQHGSPPYQTHIIFLIGLLKTALEAFDG